MNAKAPAHEFTCFQTSRTVAGYYTQLRYARCLLYVYVVCVGVCECVCSSVYDRVRESSMYACKRCVFFFHNMSWRLCQCVNILLVPQSLNLCTLQWSWQPCFLEFILFFLVRFLFFCFSLTFIFDDDGNLTQSTGDRVLPELAPGRIRASVKKRGKELTIIFGSTCFSARQRQ